jgi:hypothetical protein
MVLKLDHVRLDSIPEELVDELAAAPIVCVVTQAIQQQRHNAVLVGPGPGLYERIHFGRHIAGGAAHACVWMLVGLFLTVRPGKEGLLA